MPLGSNAIPKILSNTALVAGPPSPENPVAPVPAIVLTIFVLAAILRMRLLFLSAR